MIFQAVLFDISKYVIQMHAPPKDCLFGVIYKFENYFPYFFAVETVRLKIEKIVLTVFFVLCFLVLCGRSETMICNTVIFLHTYLINQNITSPTPPHRPTPSTPNPFLSRYKYQTGGLKYPV